MKFLKLLCTIVLKGTQYSIYYMLMCQISYGYNYNKVWLFEDSYVKAIHVWAWSGPETSGSLRLPDFKTIGTWRWWGQPYAPAAFTPQKYSWYSFLVEAELTPGPKCDRENKSMKNSNETIEKRTRDNPACSSVSQPAADSYVMLLYFGTVEECAVWSGRVMAPCWSGLYL